MKHKLVNDNPKTYFLVFDPGDDVLTALSAFAEENKISGAYFSGIGAFTRAKVGYYDYSIRNYKPIPVNEQVEVLSVTGDISQYDNKPKVHAHVVLGKQDGATIGGHLLQATVRPTLEVVLTVLNSQLNREMDNETKIPLIKL